MGGDHGPRVTVPASLRALKRHPNLSLILVGDEHKLKRYLKSLRASQSDRLKIRHASELVAMDELPSHALRNKKDSSMRVAVNLVKAGEAQACVSAGNTGALMATARYVLKTLPGIDRPAIITVLPTVEGKTRVLDLGANIDSHAETLFQFAVMGSVLVQAVENIDNPKVGLLNIGVEEMKGNEQIKLTAQLLANSGVLNYTGFVEGDGIFSGVVDVVVCDGLIGNIALKASEGLAKLILHEFKKAFARNFLTKLIGLLTYPILKSTQRQVDPASYNGASLLGLNGIVIKSHGSAKRKGFEYAIEEAMLEVQYNVPQLIGEKVAYLLSEGQMT